MSARGSIALVALPGDYGKPRPAVVVQAEMFDALPTVIVCPITSDIHDIQQPIRPIVEPSTTNGLRLRSQVMADKPHVISRGKLAGPVGRLDPADLAALDRALLLLLGLD